MASSTLARKGQWKDPTETPGRERVWNWVRVGTMSRRMRPRIEKAGKSEAETPRRCAMRAPRSWPQMMMGCGVGDESLRRREERAERMAEPVPSLSCGLARGAERP